MTGPESADATREHLYDRYVEAALAGRPREPGEYLREHGLDDGELLERLRAVHRAASRRPGPTGTDRGLPFENLGPYRVLRRLDEGGMGMVYLGAEERLGRLVALKVLRPEFQGSATQAARFEREAQVVARLRHPHIVTIFGVGEEAGMRFLAMEYVEGEGLDEIVARSREEGRPIPVATAVRWAIQVAGALQAAHEVGVVHRDVKPSNIRIAPDGNAVLLDFGVAAEEGTSRLTAAGTFLGTAAYAAPEQLRAADGAEPDGRADVYALGVVLYEALTGVQPFEGDDDVATAENVLRGEATGARRLRREIPRDLETVLQVALERNPDRRFASAAALAEDLRAVLEVRPIHARRAGPVRRVWKLARRHPVATVALFVGALAVLGAFVAEDLRRGRAARDALGEARAGVQRYRALCESARHAEGTLSFLDDLVETEHMSQEEDAALAAAHEQVHESRRAREASFHDVLSLLRRAERLDPGLDGVDDVRAALFVERWREARTIHDEDAAAFYRHLALEAAPESELAAQLQGTGRVTVTSATPGATARLFRWERLSEIDPDGESRRVPVPVGGEPALRPGTWAFRATRPHEALRTGDLIVRVNGWSPDETTWQDDLERLRSGAQVAVLGRAGTATADLGPGAGVRITTQPLEWLQTAELVGGDVECPVGPALVVVRADGHEEKRVVVTVAAGETTEVDVTLSPTGATPEGFVRVCWEQSDGSGEVVIQEREVTAAEYLEFLNDPETLAALDDASSPRLFPRSTANASDGGHWPRGADGLYVLPESWPRDWPALGLSFHDAQAYCAWWTRRAREENLPWRAALPTVQTWTKVGGPDLERLYVYGNQFHQKWAASCFSQPEARVERVLQYPRDESVHGVFDLSGGVWEWTDAWWDEERGLRRVSGGSWARAPREFFKVWGGQGFTPETASDENGFRLVLHPVDTGTR